MQGQSCCSLDNVVNLSKESMKETLLEKIKTLCEGEEFHFKADHDFSRDLIEVLQENFYESPLKAKFLEEGPEQWIIKVKLPKEGEGCCGCCG